MTALSNEFSKSFPNPLDQVEQIASRHDWLFERSSKSDIAIEISGHWCDYRMFVSWHAEVQALLFACAFDMRVREESIRSPAARYHQRTLTSRAFSISGRTDGLPVFPPRAAAAARRARASNSSRILSRSRSPNASATIQPSSSSSGAARTRKRRWPRRSWKPRAKPDGARSVSGSPKILLVGGGKMGGAMLRGWLVRGTSVSDIAVVEPFNDAARALAEETGVPVVAGYDELPDAFAADVVVFAVKPQGMDDIADLPARRGDGRGHAVDRGRADHRIFRGPSRRGGGHRPHDAEHAGGGRARYHRLRERQRQ